jgi:sugar transferase (PEP-CTERM/EpsH1 system associated)
MNVLMLCHRIPYPPVKGEKIRALHHLRALTRRHAVTLVTLADEPGHERHRDALSMFVKEVEVVPISGPAAKARSLRALWRGGPMTLEYFFARPLRERVHRLLADRRWDVIFVYCSAMAQYVEHVRDVPIVIDFVDLDSQKYLQYGRRGGPLALLYRLEGRRLEAYEQRVARRGRVNIVVSPAEARRFRELIPDARVDVLPLVVDTDYFDPASAPAPSGPATIVFVGVMDYLPNVDAVHHFADRVFPRIQRLAPGARFMIVGQRPNRAVRRLGQREGIEVTGGVPDVRPYLAQAHVAVAPFRVAQGMQTKVLEAMAMRLPVVVTSKAYEGLHAHPGRDLIVEDDSAAFAGAIARLVREPHLRASIGASARRYVQSEHSVEAGAERLERLLVGAATTVERVTLTGARR